MSIREAQQRIDSQEFTLWRAAYEIEPWGEERADIRASVLSRVLIASHGGKINSEDSRKLFDWWNYEDAPPSATPPKETVKKKIAETMTSLWKAKQLTKRRR